MKAAKGKNAHGFDPLLDFIGNLTPRLEKLTSTKVHDGTTGNIDSLCSELHSHINTIRYSGSALLRKEEDLQAHDLDSMGTKIWNAATRVRREVESRVSYSDDPSIKEILPLVALVRMLAFHILDTSVVSPSLRSSKLPRSKENADSFQKDQLRLLRVTNKSAKSCLECMHVDNCTKILERGADFVDALEKSFGNKNRANTGGVEDGELELFLPLRTEFYALRMILAWKQDNLDVAEMMLKHATRNGTLSLLPDSVERLSEALYEIGRDLLRNKDFYRAAKWLEKAMQMINQSELLNPEAEELKFSILYYLILTKIIRMMHITDSNFKLVLQKVHELNEHNPDLASKALDDFLNLRLYMQSNEEFIHRVFITIIWITVDKLSDDPSVLQSLSRTVESFNQKSPAPLDGRASHAVQMLLWKKIDHLYRQESFDPAAAWCQLALHPAFAGSGELNIAKFNRKLLSCYLAQGSYTNARSTFESMSVNARDESLTRHIMYKIALREKDEKLASECLELIARSSFETDHSLLYACVLEAQLTGHKQQAIRALQKVLSKCNNGHFSDLHLPSLLRCIARLLKSRLSEEDSPEEGVVEDICQVFEAAVAAIAAQERNQGGTGPSPFTAVELEWFVTNGYNFAFQKFSNWSSNHILRLLECCLALSSFCEPDNASNQLNALPWICHSLIAQKCKTLARKEENEEKQRQAYLKARTHISHVRERLKTNKHELHVAADAETLLHIWRKLLRSDFEAALRLKSWNDLSQIIDDWNQTNNPEGLTNFADMLMASEAPPQVEKSLTPLILSFDQKVLLETLEYISKVSTTKPDAAVAHQARWLRILHQLSLDTNASKRTHASDKQPTPDMIISRAVALSQQARQGNSETMSTKANIVSTSLYPAEELEYLATTTYNRAVDAYCTANESECHRLGQQALQVAEELAHSDGGALRAVLVKRLQGLLGGSSS